MSMQLRIGALISAQLNKLFNLKVMSSNNLLILFKVEKMAKFSKICKTISTTQWLGARTGTKPKQKLDRTVPLNKLPTLMRVTGY